MDVALILWNRDVIQLMSMVLLQRNLESCGVEPSDGVERIEKFLMSSRPRVVIFDLHPPYERSAAVALRMMHRFPDSSFVLTCADSVLALKKAPWLSRYLLFQKPYQLDEVADVVRSMVPRVPVVVGALTAEVS
jgi:hypothetical protein